MTSIMAKIIEDSISECSPRLTSVQVTLPRIILAELNTHRQFSRNYRSSRAVPVARLIQEVRTSPYEPIVWLKNKPGMQATEQMSPGEVMSARETWLQAANLAADSAEALMNTGLHKQWANRCLEPYLYVHGIITSVRWSNFYALRRHTDAQPEFKALADAIYDAINANTPKELKNGQWHIPYVLQSERGSSLHIQELIKFSVARVARVSFLDHEGKHPNVEDDLKLYDRLVGSVPLHASPSEHQATPDDPSVYKDQWGNPRLHGNFPGWVQYRKTLKGECQ
jgi:thymidylate synthase ThyX